MVCSTYILTGKADERDWWPLFPVIFEMILNNTLRCRNSGHCWFAKISYLLPRECRDEYNRESFITAINNPLHQEFMQYVIEAEYLR